MTAGGAEIDDQRHPQAPPHAHPPLEDVGSPPGREAMNANRRRTRSAPHDGQRTSVRTADIGRRSSKGRSHAMHTYT
jgi:hypothetical protein